LQKSKASNDEDQTLNDEDQTTEKHLPKKIILFPGVIFFACVLPPLPEENNKPPTN
jgi:hypothetical protein